MGAVALTSKLTLRDHYTAELFDKEKQEITDARKRKTGDSLYFCQKGLSGKVLDDVVDHVTSDETAWLTMMMREELGLEGLRIKIFTGAVSSSLFRRSWDRFPLVPFFFSPYNLRSQYQ